jgi:hypothetical protein
VTVWVWSGATWLSEPSHSLTVTVEASPAAVPAAPAKVGAISCEELPFAGAVRVTVGGDTSGTGPVPTTASVRRLPRPSKLATLVHVPPGVVAAAAARLPKPFVSMLHVTPGPTANARTTVFASNMPFACAIVIAG